MTPAEQDSSEARILVVDDEESNLLLLSRILAGAGYMQVDATTDPARVPAMFLEAKPDLVLLDLHMPDIDGFELMERLSRLTSGRPGVPFLVLTADGDHETKRRALSAGARDFLTKPVDQIELVLRVRNLLQVQQLQGRLSAHNERLEHEVAERTSDLEQARLEILDRLARAVEYRDDDTQEHAWRIGRTCALLALALGAPEREVELIHRAAPLHDIGKVGVPDAILLKRGKLSHDEFEVVKTHTTIGGEILSGSQSPVLRLAQRIALSHHERWDGGGYPFALRGEQIPLAGRIVAVADVFDALTHERPYKQAWPLERAVEEIRDQAGRQFDPGLVEAFSMLDHATLSNGVNERASLRERRALTREVRLAALAS